MCGIAGVIGEAARSPGLLDRMAGAIAHRGPDDEGIWADAEAGVGLVNRRLAIIDLSASGHQPMLSAGGRFVITFNGEIYNHPELRAELEHRGHVPGGGWRGHSDTETLLEAIAAFGLEAALERSVGMFAFALWDRDERRLSLVRDRFGEKPLYYGWAGKDFLFASELKAIRVHPSFEAAIDRRALSQFVRRSYVPAPLSIYRGIFKLEPGCVLTADLETLATPTEAPSAGYRAPGLSIDRYWSYRDVLKAGLADPIADEQQAIDGLEQVLGEAVRSQSIADVPVGAFLSGGVDSSTVVALYQKYSNLPVRTFTIGFEQQAYNEADDARAVARHFGTEHHERIVTAADARDVIPLLPQIYDEPFADSSQIPTYLVSRFAREQVTVALSGDGGDELFGGYNRYVGTARLWSLLKRAPRPARAVLGSLLGQVPARAWDRAGAVRYGRSLPPSFGEKVRKSLRTVADARDLDQMTESFLDEWGGEQAPVIDDEGGSDAWPPNCDLPAAPDALRMMCSDALGYLPGDILCKVDRASMAASLEAHVPFLDHRVAAFAARIPLAMKIRGGRGKHVLRELLYREAPRQLFERPKAGFAVPVGEWIRGPLRGWAEDLLDPRRIGREGWFDPAVVRRRWDEHVAGTRDSSMALWSILMFEAWLAEGSEGAAAAGSGRLAR